MNVKLMRLTSLALVTALLSLASIGIDAQSYPNKPIRLILSFPPGGGTDLVARVVAEKLYERWGQPVVVDNRGGGNGIIGSRVAASARPDGYTIYLGSSNHLIMGPSMYDKYPYDPIRDFVPVAPVTNQPFVLVVSASLPAHTLKELVALAKSRPGQLNFASTGMGTVGHLAGQFLQSIAGIGMVHIPYKGTGDITTALFNGEVSMAFVAPGGITPYIKAGKLRALVIAAPHRLPALPDVPTTAEANLPELLIFAWNGVFAPIGTPKEIVNELNRAIGRLLLMPDVIKRLSSVGSEPMSATPAQFSDMIKGDLDRWGKIVKGAGIEKQPL